MSYSRKIKDLIKKVPYSVETVHWSQAKYKQFRTMSDWKKAGRPLPPPPKYKADMIKSFGRNFGIKTLIETGTFLGDTIEAVRTAFHRIYSVEIEPTLYKNAVERFKDYKHIEILHGDSGEEIKKILHNLRVPAIFWLDAHYSAGNTGRGVEDSPMKVELDLICKHVNEHKLNHVLLLDDARDFWGTNGYPSIAEVMYMTIHDLPGYTCEMKDGIIRIYKPRGGNLE